MFPGDIRGRKGRGSNMSKNMETWNNLAYLRSCKLFSVARTKGTKRPGQGPWRDRWELNPGGLWKILTYLPAFREDLAQLLYNVTHIWSLTFVEFCPVCAEALCQVRTICHLPCMANWWQLWWNDVLKQKSNAYVVTSFLTALTLVHPSS